MEEKMYLKKYADFVDSVTADVSKNDNLYQERFIELSKLLNGHFSRLDNAVAGLAGEAGEVADLWKKVKFHGLEYNNELRDKFIKELGDVCWYAVSMAMALDIPFEDVINRNIEKLKKRHVNGFSPQYMKERADK